MAKRVLNLFVLMMSLLLCCPYSAKAALGLTADEAIKRLTGEGSKKWIFQRFVPLLSSDNECKAGEIWLFFSDGKVDVRKCVEGKTVKTTDKWQLQKQNELDITIHIGDKEFTILFPPQKSGSEIEEMRLRSISIEKTTPTVDMRFTHEYD